MKVSYGKEVIELDPDLDWTIADLKSNLMHLTGCNTVRLVHSGRTLSDEESVSSIPGGTFSKITMIGTKISNQEVADPSANRIRNDLSNVSSSMPGRKNGTIIPPKKSSSSMRQYRFNQITTLSGLPNEEKARSILEALASDPGVLAVMEKHKWSVGCLAEMFPEGYVGVSDVCVMGLNENHGQRILLRLRTDDLLGFRKILSIKKVLFHELAHNEVSDHNDAFYILMRQVERECSELDWRQSQSHTIGNTEFYHRHDSDAAAVSSESTVYRLGGGDQDLNGLLASVIPARLMAATAAIQRRSNEELEIENSCGSMMPPSIPKDQSKIKAPVHHNDIDSSSNSWGSMQCDEMDQAKGESIEDLTSVTATATGIESETILNVMHPSGDSLNGCIVPIIEDKIWSTKASALEILIGELLSNSVASAMQLESMYLLENLEKVGSTLFEVIRYCYPDKEFSDRNDFLDFCHQSQRNIQLLQSIVRNAKDQPEEKYRTIKKDSKAFQRLITWSGDRVVNFLVSCGFTTQEIQLKLVRQDKALLYISSELLDCIISFINELISNTGTSEVQRNFNPSTITGIN